MIDVSARIAGLKRILICLASPSLGIKVQARSVAISRRVVCDTTDLTVMIAEFSR